jgi:CCR4-NOT transcriptional regulation complex NOT5 subunit
LPAGSRKGSDRRDETEIMSHLAADIAAFLEANADYRSWERLPDDVEAQSEASPSSAARSAPPSSAARSASLSRLRS